MISARTSYHADGPGTDSMLRRRRNTRYMEHRLHPRVEVAIPVELHCCDGPLLSGMASNLSRGGIFVELPDWAWCRGCVEVCLRLSRAHGERELSVPAFAVHRNDEGVGLMFRQFEAEADDLLRRLMHGEVDLHDHVQPIPGYRTPAVPPPAYQPGR